MTSNTTTQAWPSRKLIWTATTTTAAAAIANMAALSTQKRDCRRELRMSARTK